MSRTLCFALAAMTAAALPAMAKETVHAAMHVNPGLWEVTVSPKASGEMPMDPEMMARMPAAQRAKVMAMMQSAVSKPRKMRECMTPEKLAKGFSLDRPEANCTQTVLANNASAMEVQMTCAPNRGGLTSAHFKLAVANMANVAGTSQMVFSRGGRSMTVDSTMTGQWLGSNCGKVKDVEMED